jgi:hypothetical protein
VNEYSNLFIEAWDDSIKDSMRGAGRKFKPKMPLIKCKICCLKAPAQSPDGLICEMCFDTEFELRLEKFVSNHDW